MIRIATGILALTLLLAGAFLYLFQPESQPFVEAMLIRVGAVLGVIWLAYPQLESIKGRLPAILVALALICVIILAARPSLGRIVISVVAVAVAVGGVMKWMSKMADDNPRRRK